MREGGKEKLNSSQVFVVVVKMPWKVLGFNGDFIVNLHSHGFVNLFLLMELILSWQVNVVLKKKRVLCSMDTC